MDKDKDMISDHEQEKEMESAAKDSNNPEKSQDELTLIKEEMALIKEELARQTEEKQKNYELYLRSRADIENLKKRNIREKEDYIQFANMEIIKKLLPVIDDLERALETAEKSDDFDGLHKGIEMTFKRIHEILKNEGIEVIESLGKPFDPQYHQPLMVEANDEYPENTVIEELQKGYMYKNRLIRPSLVKVSN